VLTAHDGEVVARSWTVQGKRKGKFTLGDVKGKAGAAKVRFFESSILRLRCKFRAD
jgi:hypothetical protein